MTVDSQRYPAALRSFAKRSAFIAALSFTAGFSTPWLLKPLLPPTEPGFPYVAIAASFVLNLGCLALTLAFLPTDGDDAKRSREWHLTAWITTMLVALFAFAGLWAAPVHRESFRVFGAVAFLTAAQTAVLLAFHAALRAFFGAKNRAPKTLCTLLLCVLASALFWTREPIERLSKSGGDQVAGSLADGVMKLSPPMATASAWFWESDNARSTQAIASRRFDIIHGRMTYDVWIGSYRAVANPDILPSGGGGDFYSRREFSPGIAMLMLLWALPIMALSDLTNRRRIVSTDSSRQA